MEWRELLVAVSFGIFMVCILIVAAEAIWHAHRR